jgi:UDP-N-acetylglucosamine 2-epimerase (non-hydrolysing)
MKKIKIISVVGARPNLVKIFSLLKELKRYFKIKSILVHTGQHYSKEMSDIFFKDLSLPKPDIYLGVGSGTHAQQTSKIMMRLEKVLIKERPDLAVVVGDVNSTLAAAITCVKLRIPVAHIEAGLRSFDRTMPEEINRILTDCISSYLFAPSDEAVENLRNEGIDKKKIFFVGNIMIDSLILLKDKSEKSRILDILNLKKKKYAVLTLHRPSNVDNKVVFNNILDALNSIQRHIKVIFPIHPRTKKMLRKFNLEKKLKRFENVILSNPLGYLDFMKLIRHSKFVMTDSGGIQEETTILKVPCLTLRPNTERPVTVTLGTNIVINNNPRRLIKFATKIIDNQINKDTSFPKFWDGRTAQRIASILLKGRLK